MVAGAGWKSWVGVGKVILHEIQVRIEVMHKNDWKVESYPRKMGLSSSYRESSPDFSEFALYQGFTVLLVCVIKWWWVFKSMPFDYLS